MACLMRLKDDIKFLEKTFCSDESKFRVISASLDEVVCRYITKSGTSIVINANFTEQYPKSSPVWFSEADDADVSAAIASLCANTPNDNNICRQIQCLLEELCRMRAMNEPDELKVVNQYLQCNSIEIFSSEDEDDNSDGDDDFHYEMDDEGFSNL